VRQQQLKIGLTVPEVGWLLQKTEAQVRGMLGREELKYAVSARLIEIESLRPFIDTDLGRFCLDALTQGHIRAPLPDTRWGSRRCCWAPSISFSSPTNRAPKGHADRRSGGAKEAFAGRPETFRSGAADGSNGTNSLQCVRLVEPSFR
jgi:hypothetical protein